MKIKIKFCKDLSFFLPQNKKNKYFIYLLERRTNIKDIIEATGIPHTEVGSIIINNKNNVDFSFIPVSDLTMDVSAVKSPANLMEPSSLRKETIEEFRFLADTNVIKLGRLLILLGFDVKYSSSFSDEEIADIAHNEKRIVLSRDTALLKRSKIIFARRIRKNHPYDQLKEVFIFFNLQKYVKFFSRCSLCNKILEKIDKEKVLHFLEPKTKKYFNLFYHCPGCRKIFWKGSHYDNIKTNFSKIGINL